MAGVTTSKRKTSSNLVGKLTLACVNKAPAPKATSKANATRGGAPKARMIAVLNAKEARISPG